MNFFLTDNQIDKQRKHLEELENIANLIEIIELAKGSSLDDEAKRNLIWQVFFLSVSGYLKVAQLQAENFSRVNPEFSPYAWLAWTMDENTLIAQSLRDSAFRQLGLM